jgi:primosomal protein N'
MKPTPALIYKLKNKYRFHVIIKSLKTERNVRIEPLLKNIQRFTEEINLHSSERVIIDVDPVNFV